MIIRSVLDRRIARDWFRRSLRKDAVGYTRKRQIARILLRESLCI